MHFHQARPIWLAGREQEMNVTVGFRAVVEEETSERKFLRLTASMSIYRVYVRF
ncbi:hypothetical protein [Cohnella soli]|uniref:Uncharacterized protein n=1 Tax=Cohnella soli TaxID=425005 RepID=A0ABW0I506_9BACL